MNKLRIQSVVVAVALGVVVYFVSGFLVGYGAAIAIPSWYLSFSQERTTLALLIWQIFTVVPIIAIVGIAAGFALARFSRSGFLAAGIIAVFTVHIVSALFFSADMGFAESFRAISIPSNILDLPSLIAAWFVLPLASRYFGNRDRPA